jgi:hypothetical protein
VRVSHLHAFEASHNRALQLILVDRNERVVLFVAVHVLDNALPQQIPHRQYPHDERFNVPLLQLGLARVMINDD